MNLSVLTYKKWTTLALFLLVRTLSTAQVQFMGTVANNENKKPLFNVNIRIRQKNFGAVSGPDGNFSISIPIQHLNDSLTFSMIGYLDRTIPISEIKGQEVRIVYLSPKSEILKPVTINRNKLVERKFGVVKDKGILQLGDGSTNQDDIFEIAQLIKIDRGTAKVTSVNLYINDTEKDNATFRINFYDYNGVNPGKEKLKGISSGVYR